MKPRQWQTAALAACKRENPALIEAFPGAGKTVFAGLDLKRRFDSGEINGVVFVVPTRPLKESVQAGLTTIGLNIKDQQKDGQGFPTQYHGVAVCYAQLPNLVSTFEQWANTGRRLAFVFDEVHHASENNTWGDAANDCARIATRTLAMTGTPFRGDGRRIAFVNYDKDGRCVPTYGYGYAQAVADSVCRPVEFCTDDGVADFLFEEMHSVRISETPDHFTSQVNSTVFQPRHDFLRKVVTKADDKLTEMRIDDEDAGGLIVCRPGTDDDDNRHIDQVANMVEELTGEAPVVVKHDDMESGTKISSFRNSRQRWILSVRMVSEGIDIKRLRVCVMATTPTTELLFRQIIGRVVRVESGCENHNAEVFMAKFPSLVQFAERIEGDAEAGLRERKERKEKEEREDRRPSMLMPLGASHEDGGSVAMGVQFTAEEISAAENERSSHPLLRTASVIAIAHLRRRYGVAVPVGTEDSIQPEQVRRKKLRKDLNRGVRHLAASKDLGHGEVWAATYQYVGARDLDDLCDNMPIEKLESAINFIASWAARP